MPAYTQQILLIDADDTLWENNIYFEQAIADFTTWLLPQLSGPQLSPSDLRHHLNTCEHATIAAHGYGLHSFRRSLADCCAQLKGAPITPAQQALVRKFTAPIEDHQIELLPGVADTLPVLASRHRLYLVTKGHPEEQTGKLHRSGLAQYFSGVEVLPEKHQQAYRTLAAHHRLDHDLTWMIGNSPKSDIDPALAAGLHAVFLPHEFTWQLEHEELDPVPAGQTLLTLPGFSHLTEYF